MSSKFFVFIIKDLFINPVKAWETIDLENKPGNHLRNGFLFPLILLVSVSAFLGSFLFTNVGLSSVYSIFAGIKCFILFYITVYASAYILRKISHVLDLEINPTISFRLIVYSIVPFMLCQVVSCLFESLLFVDVLSLFGLYIFWVGAERILTAPANKKLLLLTGIFICFIGIFVATDFLLSKLFDRIFFTFFS